ncbi:hypothetical protein IRY44_24975 [Micromonospora sp. ANENR4]|uniref:hypothetical protein n=1 Tax=Micromonospora sp. ANENR4 TaxID=2783662 RepID=UPI00188E8138|nr:hypothetical protein [Micromonospora sp. ANENR4]MBF5033012.1 hypothetical protein [Micromonospora sp. ANENR4]
MQVSTGAIVNISVRSHDDKLGHELAEALSADPALSEVLVPISDARKAPGHFDALELMQAFMVAAVTGVSTELLTATVHALVRRVRTRRQEVPASPAPTPTSEVPAAGDAVIDVAAAPTTTPSVSVTVRGEVVDVVITLRNDRPPA